MYIKSPLGSLYYTLLLLVIFGGMQSLGNEIPLEFYAVSDLVRIFADGYQMPAPQKNLDIFGIRNETVSAQCVIHAKQDLKNVEISVSPIQHTENSYSLPTECVRWNFVGSIFISKNTKKLRKTDIIREAPAYFPDYLTEDQQISLAAGKYQAVYLTVVIPKDAAAGTYRGTVTVKTEVGDQSLPIQLTIYPLTLPDERHLQVTEWFSTGNFKKFHGIDGSDSDAFYQMLHRYADNMVEHRQNVFQLGLERIAFSRDAQGQFHFDFSKFDRWADIFWNTGKMDKLETGFVARFGEGGWSSKEVSLRDFSVRNEIDRKVEKVPGKELLPIFLPALVKHLQEKGWLEKTLFHIADEPSNHNIMAWREASDFVHRCAPQLRRLDAIETTHCQDRLEVWIPKLDHFSTYLEAYQKAQQQGNEMWFYTVGIYQGGSLPNKTVDVALIESRLLHWLNYRYGLTGYLHWGFNHWSDDPLGSPGEHNGDGWHVYPGKNGLLDSLRWEQMRNGIQDYEYLWLLEAKTRAIIKTLGERLSILDPSRRSLEIATQIIKTCQEFSRDPNTLYAAKKQIIEELLDLDKSPCVLVQTNPMEHTAIARNCAVDLFGYAEPGTRISVNGSELPVAADGLFMENISLSKENTIVIYAESPKGNKKIVRSFAALF